MSDRIDVDSLIGVSEQINRYLTNRIINDIPINKKSLTYLTGLAKGAENITSALRQQQAEIAEIDKLYQDFVTHAGTMQDIIDELEARCGEYDKALEDLAECYSATGESAGEMIELAKTERQRIKAMK